MATPKANGSHPAMIHLTGIDPVMARIIAQVGPYDGARRRERFPALERAIIFQQLAGTAARAILKRFIALAPGRKFPSPEQVVAMPIAKMRKAGLSKPKALYIKGLAAAVVAKKVNFHRFPNMEDAEIIAELTQVKGIGQWTAEMFLMFNLGRPDVMPAGDLGVQTAVMKAYGLAKRPTPKELREFAERWKPHRTAAAWYLWRSLDVVLPVDVVKVPAKKKS
ncbi:MAG TPA: DNA-3-methyladenine glycosylase [Candidatus Binataceae bacterium]|nr:DNA-3-methyladenine glycosylase [Candidatus Binataceae bacterium]